MFIDLGFNSGDGVHFEEIHIFDEDESKCIKNAPEGETPPEGRVNCNSEYCEVDANCESANCDTANNLCLAVADVEESNTGVLILIIVLALVFLIGIGSVVYCACTHKLCFAAKQQK